MKKKPGFTLHHLGTEHIIIAEGKENIDFTNLITLNDTAAYLYEQLPETFSIDDMTALLTAEYDVDEPHARHDSTALATTWLAIGLVEQ